MLIWKLISLRGCAILGKAIFSDLFYSRQVLLTWKVWNSVLRSELESWTLEGEDQFFHIWVAVGHLKNPLELGSTLSQLGL